MSERHRDGAVRVYRGKAPVLAEVFDAVDGPVFRPRPYRKRRVDVVGHEDEFGEANATDARTLFVDVNVDEGFVVFYNPQTFGDSTTHRKVPLDLIASLTVTDVDYSF